MSIKPMFSPECSVPVIVQFLHFFCLHEKTHGYPLIYPILPQSVPRLWNRAFQPGSGKSGVPTFFPAFFLKVLFYFQGSMLVSQMVSGFAAVNGCAVQNRARPSGSWD